MGRLEDLHKAELDARAATQKQRIAADERLRRELVDQLYDLAPKFAAKLERVQTLDQLPWGSQMKAVAGEEHLTWCLYSYTDPVGYGSIDVVNVTADGQVIILGDDLRESLAAHGGVHGSSVSYNEALETGNLKRAVERLARLIGEIRV